MTGKILFGVLRHERSIVLASLTIVVLLAWAYLLLGVGTMMSMRLEWSLGYAAIVFVMWTMMMVAMMLPSAAPVTLLMTNIARKRTSGGAVGASTVFFVLGYLAVWIGFSLAATAIEWVLSEVALLNDTMALGNTMLAGGVLIAAGIYQWTPLKAVCLRHCRSPLDFLLFHWRDGTLGALLSGAQHGVFCLGCCWMLMALLFVVGVMNLAWIGALAFLVLIEKTLPWGELMSRAIGVAFAAWGIVVLALAT